MTCNHFTPTKHKSKLYAFTFFKKGNRLLHFSHIIVFTDFGTNFNLFNLNSFCDFLDSACFFLRLYNFFSVIHDFDYQDPLSTFFRALLSLGQRVVLAQVLHCEKQYRFLPESVVVNFVRALIDSLASKPLAPGFFRFN